MSTEDRGPVAGTVGAVSPTHPGASSRAGLAVPGRITRQADVTPAGTVPACCARLPACQSLETLIAGKMCHGAESPGRLLLLLRLRVRVSSGPWTARLATCPHAMGLWSKRVQV